MDQNEQIAILTTEMAHLTKSFDEFKADTKEFHKLQTAAAEEMRKQFSDMAISMNILIEVQAKANKNSEWIAKNSPLLEEIMNERKDNRKRFIDYFFKFGWLAFGIGFIIWANWFSQTKTIELQDSAYLDFTNTLDQIYEAQNKE